MEKEISCPAAGPDYTALVRAHNERLFERTGRVPAALVRTYGCAQNASDGEKLSGMLAEMGYTFTVHAENADFILYNTCAIRENAEERVFGNVGALKRQKKQNPELIIGLCGCMTQQEHIVDKIRASYPYVDLVFGTYALHRLPELLYRRLSGTKRVVDIEESGGDIAEGLPVRREGAVKAGIPIMYGCNNFCTYCVVPLVRGRERSREPGPILDEARGLVEAGYRDITLLGQNVNSYGKTLAQPMPFAALLRAMNRLPGDFRIRFMTSHPKDCTRELIDAVADCEKVVNHIHLPVQSGSDRILAAMNRGYTSAHYLSLIDYAVKTIPGVTFTSDIIVGFPGETGEDFEKTLALVRRVRYLSLFTFLYSRREGTKAAEMEDPVSRAEKMERFRRLLDVQDEIGAAHHGALVGATVRVLAEGSGKTGPEYLTGRTQNNIIVDFTAPADVVGQFADVRITQAQRHGLLGHIM